MNNNRKRLFILIAAGLVFAAAAARAAAAVILVESGTPRAAVILPAEPADDERLAATELVEHLALMTGAHLAITRETPPPGLLPVYLGAAADEALDRPGREAGVNPSTFTLRVAPGRIDVRGLSAEGTLFGVYELLEQLGFRWYIPGDLGRVIPAGDSAQLAVQETTQRPSMDYRVLQAVAPTAWYRRQRLGGEARSTGSHGLPGVPHRGALSNRLFAENPEIYALVGGERRRSQHCVSNPDLFQLVLAAIRDRLAAAPDLKYLGMGPNDGRGYCECENCRALDGGVHDPLYGQESMTDRYVWLFNRLLAELEDDYPDLHLVWYVYGLHSFPPAAVKPDPRIVGVFAPISMDRIRGMDNPMSPDRHVFRALIDGWAALEPNEIYYRGYYNNLACPGFPKSQLDRVRHEIPALREKGINVMRVETIRQSWASDPITLHAATRMMWDVNTDLDALLDEFYRKFYGPAEAPMRAWHEAIESAFADSPYFSGSSYVYFPLFDSHRRTTLRRHLARAAARAPRGRAGLYGERVWAVSEGFRRLEIFLDMIAARNRHDFARAHALMEEYNTLSDALSDYELEVDPDNAGWIRLGRDHRLVNRREHSSDRGSYFNRFFEQPISSGYQRAVEIGEMVAALPDEWDFLLDPSGIGELGGWQRPGPLGGNWQRLATTSRTWSDQGLHYYKGKAWYRTAVEIPARFAGRRLYLWVGGVDNIAHVWINGQFVGTSREPEEGLPGVPGSFRPFDMPATGAARFGEENTVTIMVDNFSLSELGTGGIMGPVMFWAPHDPDWRP